MAQARVTYSEADRIWSGPPSSSIYNSDASLGALMFHSMKNWPKNILQIWDDDGVVVTSEQALTWAIRIAQFLKSRGLTHKDVIGIVAGHSKFLLPLGVACLMNGTPFHSPHSVLDEATLRHVFSITKPSLIFCDGNIYEKVRKTTIEWQPEIYTLTDHVDRVPTIETLLEPTTTEMFYQPEPLVEGGDQTMALLCSSGTTGLPKVVCVSNRRLMLFTYWPIHSESIVLSASALDWSVGLTMLGFHTVLSCTRILSRKEFTPEYFVHLVRTYKVDVIFLSPNAFTGLVNCSEATSESLSSIRTFVYGGGSIAMTTLQRGQELCRNATLMKLYGSSETGIVTYNFGLKTSTLGESRPGARIRIVGENGENLSHNQVGEICVHTGLAWKGYYGNPEASHQIQDSEGWIHSGDLGYFNEHNLLFMVDRCKDILKYQALHYWPGEIEGVISELPQVQEVCVVGIRNEVENDEAGALVVLRKGSTISASEIEDHVARRLPAVHKQLHAGVQFTKELPVNPNGKVVRKAALNMFKDKKNV